MYEATESKTENPPWRPAVGRSRWKRRLVLPLGLACTLLFGCALTAVGADVLPVGQFYQKYCANCHGVHGNNPGLVRIFPDLPDFADPNWEATHTKAELTESILHGKGAMPAYEGDLHGHTAPEVVDYLREFSRDNGSGTSKVASSSDPPASTSADPPPPSGSQLPVAQVYQRYCASCHGVDGKNPKLVRIFPDLPDFADPNWEATHTKAELTESILHGKGGMPAYQGDLKGHTPSELIDYLRSFSQRGRTR